MCSAPGFLHKTFLFQKALYISERNYVWAVITLYIDCYTHMIINISHVWCCGEMKVIAWWLELFSATRHTGGNIKGQEEQITSLILCKKPISKCNFKVFLKIFFSMVKFSLTCCFFLCSFCFCFCFFPFILLKFWDFLGGKKKFKLLGLSHGSFSHLWTGFFLYLVVFIAILLSLCISAAGSGLKQAFAGNWKKVFFVCVCVLDLDGLSAFTQECGFVLPVSLFTNCYVRRKSGWNFDFVLWITIKLMLNLKEEKIKAYMIVRM